jgi:hypothetical protein
MQWSSKFVTYLGKHFRFVLINRLKHLNMVDLCNISAHYQYILLVNNPDIYLI